MFRFVPAKLHDCVVHGAGSGSELFIVEGDSASKSVVRARDCRVQAVLPMQGKPLNTLKASRATVARNDLFRNLIAAIGAGWDDDLDLRKARYQRVILLFDPDADGIHCGALVSMFFFRWMRPLMESGSIFIARAPLYEIRSTTSDERLHAYSDDHYHRIRDQLVAKDIPFQGQRYRGLASMNESALVATCIAPATRNLTALSVADAEAAIRIFGGGAEPTRR